MAKVLVREQASLCTVSVKAYSPSADTFFLISSPFLHSQDFSMLPLYSKHDFIKGLCTVQMFSCTKELGIMSGRKRFRAQLQKTQAQMTSFLASLHGVVLGQNMAINVPFKF